MEIIDTHCHIHTVDSSDEQDLTVKKWRNNGQSADEIIADANKAEVTRLICVGTDVTDSELAVRFVQNRANCWASVGVHPHEAQKFLKSKNAKSQFTYLLEDSPLKRKIVAVGECGLDYFYEHSPKVAQIELLHFQLELAVEHDLPVIFHVREAFADFWPIFDQYEDLRGVLHSFTGTEAELEQALSRGLYIGLNGIMTFTKDPDQLTMAKSVPIERLLLETDAPYLTPKPFRGKICKPEHVRFTAEFLAELRGESPGQVAEATTKNAIKLFNVA